MSEKNKQLVRTGRHLGEWLGVAPTNRRFERVDEIYISASSAAASRRRTAWRTT